MIKVNLAVSKYIFEKFYYDTLMDVVKLCISVKVNIE